LSESHASCVMTGPSVVRLDPSGSRDGRLDWGTVDKHHTIVSVAQTRTSVEQLRLVGQL
jgi:hypothetical protein